jgi:hypothetical protein
MAGGSMAAELGLAIQSRACMLSFGKYSELAVRRKSYAFWWQTALCSLTNALSYYRRRTPLVTHDIQCSLMSLVSARSLRYNA